MSGGGSLDQKFHKGLIFKMGPAHVHRYLRPLFEKIENGQIGPSFVATHVLPLEEAPAAYELFKKKLDGCVKVVLKP
jgi:threonine dehydrogenase-like Zn-dependent dehydrogenase